uniref:RFX-type winged-helix domain-containing protein n=1 Tax=Ascaris lumbricoides TaxID=6252 RepID=A0A0M3IDK9_ASCLU
MFYSEEESQRVETQPSILSVNDVERFETQRRQIQEALNQQTYHQFRAYAQQQFVGDPVQVIFKFMEVFIGFNGSGSAIRPSKLLVPHCGAYLLLSD